MLWQDSAYYICISVKVVPTAAAASHGVRASQGACGLHSEGLGEHAHRIPLGLDLKQQQHSRQEWVTGVMVCLEDPVFMWHMDETESCKLDGVLHVWLCGWTANTHNISALHCGSTSCRLAPGKNAATSLEGWYVLLGLPGVKCACHVSLPVKPGPGLKHVRTIEDI